MRIVRIFFVFLLLIIINYSYECLAFARTYGYNYEVTSVTFDGIYGTIEGWAILNAGVTDGSNEDGKLGSPYLDRNLESNTTNSYQYNLRVYGVNADRYGNYKEVKYINATKQKVSKALSLYKVMCDKDDGKCISSHSARYDNVNYKFNFNFNDFLDSSKTYNAAYPNLPINGYKFVLTVKSTNGVCKGQDNEYCKETFPLSFLKNAVSESARIYFNSNTYLNTVYFIANDAWLRSGVCSTGRTIKKIYNAGGTYSLLDTEKCDSNEVTYYKIKVGNKQGWVPSSFIAPLKTTFTIMQNNVCDVDGNKMIFPGQENKTSTNSCEAIVNMTDEAKDSCITQDKTEYYTITCKDYMESVFTPSKSKYYRGDDFDIEAKITGNVVCTGVFDYNKWRSQYNLGDSLSRKNLEKIRDNFINFSMKDYTLNPTGKITYETSSATGKKTNLDLVISEKAKNIEEKKMSVKYVNSGNTIPESFTYRTNKVQVIMKLSKPIEVNSDKKNTPYKVTISNIGYSSKSKVNFDCEIEKILAIYRPIDLENPFISSDRIIGENWKNSKYDFTGIIKEDMWTNVKHTPQYVFILSRDNIRKISNNNLALGASAYLGSDCKYINKEYQCSFIRNKDFFTNIYINGKQL